MSDHNAPLSNLPLFASAAPQAKARRADPESSHEAARRASEHLRASQEAVLRFFRVEGEMTDEQLVARYQRQSRNYPAMYPPQTDSGLRTRRHELVMLSKIVFTGRHEVEPGERRRRIWRLARGGQ